MKTQLENANQIPAVYSAIVNVMSDMGAISKSRKNTQQNYFFRGVDDVMNSLQPLLIKHNLIILPEVIRRGETERASKSGGVILQVVVDMKFTLISVVDGSKLETVYTGEGMDSGDKATNKAMATAYKYFCFQTFCIPTEEAKDSENDSHEIAKPTEEKRPAQNNAQAVTPNAAVVNDDDKPWLNLVNKNGSPNEKGEAVKKFISEGGTIEQIAKKYKISKAVRAELQVIADSAKQSGEDLDRILSDDSDMDYDVA